VHELSNGNRSRVTVVCRPSFACRRCRPFGAVPFVVVVVVVVVNGSKQHNLLLTRRAV